MLSRNAFNALLKTLEEPPPHVKFIFATTEIRKVPVTILSRCQRFDLRRMDAGTLTAHYGKIARLENVEAEDEALRLIARAAEGSVRDGLSLLDQAIAYGDGKVKTADVMAMLGLMDKGQVIDLFDAVMAGDTARALAEADKQYQGGGDPGTILTDLADFVHWVTRLKVVPNAAAADGARTEDEKTRGADFAKKLNMPHLTRAWQMLLKGISETALAANPMQAAEMVLIRLAHAANLPSGDELMKQVQSDRASAPRTLLPQQSQPQQPMAEARVTSQIMPKQADQTNAPQTIMRSVSDFAGIVALAGEKRDIRFKDSLERFVRPITVADGRIEMALEQGADPAIANELSRKLEQWTGKRWIVAVSRAGGGETIAQQKKDAKASAFKWAREQKDVQAILKAFPGAEITNVTEIEVTEPTEENTDEESR